MITRRNWSARQGPSIVTIGNFDGVHLGHAALLDTVKSQAGADLQPLVVTFDPHPLAVLRPQDAPARLIDLRDKVRLLEQAGAARINVMNFTSRLAAMPARAFVERLVDDLGMASLVVGDDFRFGAGRQGDVLMLQDLADEIGYELQVIDTREVAGVRVSSKAIRGLLANSDLAGAAAMLGRRYTLAGRVKKGLGLGGQLGMPTANIRFAGHCALDGVYAAYADVAGEVWPAALSVGHRQAIGGTAQTIEAHLLGAAGDLYGKRLTIEPVELLRAQRDFASLDELQKAMAADVEQCAAILDGAASALGV